MQAQDDARHSALVVSSKEANIALLALFLIATLNFLDRNIVLILQEPIKADLQLSDTQLGSLTGLSFAVVYTLAALPIARLADRLIRVRIIAASVATWSLLTALSGAAVSFVMLVALRMGVAAGEAGSNPASLSLLSDYFRPEKRPIAFAIWGQCQPVGSALGLLIGGSLAHVIGWRGTLVAVGLFGLILAPFVLRLKEPPRGYFDVDYSPALPPPLHELWSILFGNRALRYLLAGAGLHAFVFVSIQSWSAPFYARAFSIPMDQLAFYMAVIVGVAGSIGIMLGGVLAHILAPRDVGWLMRLPALALLVGTPLLLAQLLVPNAQLSLAFGFAATVSLTVLIACMNVAAQSLVMPSARAVVAVAIIYTTNLFGVALGPTAVGVISDALARLYGMDQDSLRYALIASVSAAPLAALCFFRSATLLKGAIARPTPGNHPAH